MNQSIARVYLFCLILCCSVFAQIPNAPSAVKKEHVFLAPLKHPEFYVGVGAFASSAIADVHSTKACERNMTCVEAYKGHDTYTYVTPLIGLVAAGTYGCELMLHEHKWWRRFACSGIGIGMSIQHWKDTVNIYPNDRMAKP